MGEIGDLVTGGEGMMSSIVLMFLAMVIVPVTVYFAVKLGTIAFYKGRRFVRNQKRRDDERAIRKDSSIRRFP